MRVAIAQINTTVGDIDGNVRKILEVVGRASAEEVGFTVFPELTITGYPPEDLLAKPHFVEKNLDALEMVAGACGNIAFVGYVDRVGDDLFNAVAMCGNNRVLRVYQKRRLPNYGVFDEKRYFTQGEDPGLIELGGTMFAATICEDMWVPEIAEELVGMGTQVIFNISASPYHTGKGEEREQMLAKRAEDNGVWLVYCNLVGGQDELVFDGRSAIFSPTGKVMARAASFEEDFLIADFAPEGRLGASEHMMEPPGGAEEVYRALTLGLGDYVHKNGFSDVVLGLSGGIDSALTATIATDALGAEHVHGVLMPSRYSSAGSIDDSIVLAKNLGIETTELSIETAFEAFEQTLSGVFEGEKPDVTEENLQARIRGTLLMALSNKFGWLVLATGNKSELSVGYSTLYGDMVGGFAPIKDLLKMRVYELAQWRNSGGEVIPGAIITKAPSAELRPEQIDEDSLPPYETLDAILAAYVEQDRSIESIVAEGHDRAMVESVTRMVDSSEYKRRQGPLGIRITPKAFGKDRRMPVTSRFRG